jgi:membrane protease YdiL (CAAX protease family)
MADPQDPSAGESVPVAWTAPVGVPLARPVTVPPPVGGGPKPDELLVEASTAGAAWLDVAGLILCMFLLELLAGVAMGIIVDIPPDSLDAVPSPIELELMRTLLLPVLAVRAAGSIAIIAVILAHRRQSAASVGLSSRGLALDCLIGAGATAVAYGLIIFSSMTLWLVWPELLDQMEENAQRIQDMVPRLHPLGFAGMAAMVGLYEELVFRGFLMTRLRRATGSWALAVLVSTAIFTALHALDQTHAALISVTILSLVFSAVTIWRRSLVPAIVAHALFDLSQLLGLYYVAGDSWV